MSRVSPKANSNSNGRKSPKSNSLSNSDRIKSEQEATAERARLFQESAIRLRASSNEGDQGTPRVQPEVQRVMSGPANKPGKGEQGMGPSKGSASKSADDFLYDILSDPDTIDEKFGNKFQAYGNADGTRAAVSYIKSFSSPGARSLIGDVCISFMEKPKILLLSGKTKGGKGDGKGWPAEALKCLPTYAINMNPSDAAKAVEAKKVTTKDYIDKMRAGGVTYDISQEVLEAWYNINMTAVKNIAFFSIKTGLVSAHNMNYSWLKKHNEGKPLSEFNTTLIKGESKTVEILKKNVELFMNSFSMLGKKELDGYYQYFLEEQGVTRGASDSIVSYRVTKSELAVKFGSN